MIRIHEATDLDSYLAELVRSSLWDIGYHERGLHKVDRLLKTAKEVIEGAGFNFQEMVDEEAEGDLHDDGFESIQSLCHGIVRDQLGTREHHEDGLQEAHKQMALIKIMLARGRFDVDMAAIAAEVQADLDRKA